MYVICRGRSILSSHKYMWTFDRKITVNYPQSCTFVICEREINVYYPHRNTVNCRKINTYCVHISTFCDLIEED